MDVTHIPAPASYHWTPTLQREFLEHLAATGSVKLAAQRVSMSTAAVYQLRQRTEGEAFKIGCGAAVLIAPARLADQLLHRAIRSEARRGGKECVGTFRSRCSHLHYTKNKQLPNLNT